MLLFVIALFLAPPLDMTQPVTQYADVSLRWDKGALTVERVMRGQLPHAPAFRRWRGRFEARALGAGKPLELVRFDFPLLAAAEVPDEMSAEAAEFGKQLRQGVTATTVVRLPLPDGATAASIYDTETRRAVPVTLPPKTPPAGGAGTKK